MLEKEITMIDEEGNEILCEVLNYFYLEQFNKDYVVISPYETDDEGARFIEVLVYSPDDASEDGKVTVQEIESEEEWEIVEEVVNTLIDEFELDKEV